MQIKPKSKQAQGPRVRILIGSATALGPGKVDLLRAIAAHGSISAAARDMNMSYRRAWTLVDTMNGCFKGDLVETNTGGKGGGGACVTDLGMDVIRRYADMEAKAAESVTDEIRDFAMLLNEDNGDG